MTKVHVIFPRDETTNFLMDIVYCLNDLEDEDYIELDLRRLNSQEDHNLAIQELEELPNNELIVFLGHGTSCALSGSSTTEHNHGVFIENDGLKVFEHKKILLLSCKSNEYLESEAYNCGIKGAIGFPNLITDDSETSYPEDPAQIEGLTVEDIENFRKVITDSVKQSLSDYFIHSLTFHSLYKRIELRVRRALLDEYKNSSGETPLGKQISAMLKGMSFYGN